MADGELTDEAHTSVDWCWSNEQDQQVSIEVNTDLKTQGNNHKMCFLELSQGTWNHVVIAELDPCPYARP